MTLVLTLVLLAIALTALFLGLAIFLQGYLYSQPADQLPIRAAVAGLLLAMMITGWTYLNTRASHPDKYGTLFEFNPSTVREVNEFEAIRRLASKDASGQNREQTVKYKWSGEGKQVFVETETNREFKLNAADYMTVALLVPEGEGNSARFDAQLENGRYSTPERRFVEQGGSRYIDGVNPRLMMIPNRGALLAALALNIGHFLIWLIAFWPIMRFNLGHALGLAIVFGGVTMFVLMPLLFKQNEVRPGGVGPAPVAAPAR